MAFVVKLFSKKRRRRERRERGQEVMVSFKARIVGAEASSFKVEWRRNGR